MEIEKFIKKYTKVFPEESLPTMNAISMLRRVSTISIESKYNMMYLKESEGRYEVLAHWCIANNNSTNKSNMTAFFEVLRLVKNLDKPVVIANLNPKYYRVTKEVDARLRRFK